MTSWREEQPYRGVVLGGMVRKVNSEQKNQEEVNVKFRTINSIQPGDGLNEMKPRLQVMKFGGTSVGDAACIARTAQIIAAAAKESGCVAVVSAMSGVTNRLIEAAKKAQEGNAAGAAEVLDALRQQHEAALLILIPHEEKRARLRQQMEEVLAERSHRSDGVDRNGRISRRRGTANGIYASEIASAIAAAIGERNRAGRDRLHRRNCRRATDDAGKGRLRLFGDDPGRRDGSGRSHHLDRRRRRADGGPAAGSGGAHDSGDFLPRSRRAGVFW